MSYNSRAPIMRDKDGLDEQRWQTPAADNTRSNDPLSELARIVGQGFPMPPAQNYSAGQSHAPLPAQGMSGQGDWVDEIEQAFAHIPQPYTPPPAANLVGGQAAPAVPAWLRSPVVPQLPVPEGVRDPRLNPEAFTQSFHQELSSVSTASHSYYADDAYHLAAGQDGNNQWDGSWDNAQAQEQAYEQHDHSYGAYGDLDGDHRQGFADDEYDDEAYLAAAPRPRRGWVYAAIACGIGAIAVAGTFAFRSGGVISNEVPIIAADSQPVKVEPETPGGEEVPNINKAIYEHTNQAPTGEGAVVVDNREQPVDVNQMLIQQGAAQAQAEAESIAQRGEDVATTTTHTTTIGSASDVNLPEAPETTSPALVSLGEPKRVRTVSVRPDGSIAPSSGPSAPSSPKVAEVDAPRGQRVPVPAAVTVPTPRAEAANRQATRAPLQLGPTQAAPQAPAEVVAATPAPATGSYTVQLAAPRSENEARNLYSNLQRRHGELAGYSPNIVRAETGGRTIYRLRVGSFSSRDAATALCVRIQATGGQCFVARN